jgi:hypothetical protein
LTGASGGRDDARAGFGPCRPQNWRKDVRFNPLIAATLLLSLSSPASAQEWIEYVSKEDRFTVNFPGQPTVTRTTYMSQYGAELPARVYSVDNGKSRYSLTVADYSQIEKLLTAKAQKCPVKNEGCYGGTGFSGVGHWRLDFHGAIVHATQTFLLRDAKVTQLNWNTFYSVGGNQLHLTNRDGSRTLAGIYMHTQKLYIIEGTVPEGAPLPALFQQSIGWIDEKGTNIRYESLYHHAFPTPPRGNPPGEIVTR